MLVPSVAIAVLLTMVLVSPRHWVTRSVVVTLVIVIALVYVWPNKQSHKDTIRSLFVTQAAEPVSRMVSKPGPVLMETSTTPLVKISAVAVDPNIQEQRNLSKPASRDKELVERLMNHNVQNVTALKHSHAARALAELQNEGLLTKDKYM